MQIAVAESFFKFSSLDKSGLHVILYITRNFQIYDFNSEVHWCIWRRIFNLYDFDNLINDKFTIDLSFSLNQYFQIAPPIRCDIIAVNINSLISLYFTLTFLFGSR